MSSFVLVLILLAGCSTHSPNFRFAGSFRFIGPNTTLQEVNERAGPCNGVMVSLLFADYSYDLFDGSRVKIELADGKIVWVAHVDKQGRVIEIIYKRQQPVSQTTSK